MVLAYILVKIEGGKDLQVLNKLKSMKGIKKASLTYGIHDLCIDVELESIEVLDNFVFNILRKIEGVKETVTLIASTTLQM
jgi:DNA-binding Lrp family transcriptional regulator